MQKFNFAVLAFLLYNNIQAQAPAKNYTIHTVAFYNVENFYDTVNDPKTRDDEWVYSGNYYKNKIANLAKIIAQIGSDENRTLPTVVGLAEVENQQVVNDLVRDPMLASGDYGVVHFESPDKRGIDNALIYRKNHFTLLAAKNIPLMIYEKDTRKSNTGQDPSVNKNNEVQDESGRIYTRDQILVKGMLDGEEFYFIVNHWPSRRGGEAISAPLRDKAAALNLKIIDSLYNINPEAQVISMGDLNDGPLNNSLKKILKAKAEKKEVQPRGIYNPSEKMYRSGNSTLFYRDAGDIFDQIFMTEAVLQPKGYHYWKAGIYRKPFMIQSSGQYKGYPLRNNKIEPGYSDHLPAYIYLIRQTGK